MRGATGRGTWRRRSWRHAVRARRAEGAPCVAEDGTGTETWARGCPGEGRALGGGASPAAASPGGKKRGTIAL